MRKILKIHIFHQVESECAVAATALIANYYDKNQTYDKIRPLAKKIAKDVTTEGLYDGDIGVLLNKIGFKKVTLITSNLKYVDYSWNDLTKKELIKEIKRTYLSKGDKNRKAVQKKLFQFIKNSKKNNIVVDYDFGKYIRENIKKNKPVLVTYNWNSLFKETKTDKYGNYDSIRGQLETHMVVAVGFDNKYVYLADSHKNIRDELTYIKKGLYKVSFEHLMTVIEDIFLVENYK